MHIYITVFAAVFAITSAEESGLQVDSTVIQGCETANCDLECKGKSYNRGTCEMQECTCWKKTPERANWTLLNEMATNFKDKSGNEVEACEHSVQCLEACQHHEAVGGFCLKSVCWCTMTHDRKKTTSPRVRPIISLQGNNTTGIASGGDGTTIFCQNKSCSTSCQDKNKAFGVCKDEYCWCSELRTVQAEVGRSLSDIPSKTPEK